MSYTGKGGRYHTHCREEETEGLRREGTCPRPHSCTVIITRKADTITSIFLSVPLEARAPLVDLLGYSECPEAWNFLPHLILNSILSNEHLCE